MGLDDQLIEEHHLLSLQGIHRIFVEENHPPLDTIIDTRIINTTNSDIDILKGFMKKRDQSHEREFQKITTIIRILTIEIHANIIQSILQRKEQVNPILLKFSRSSLSTKRK